MMKRILLAVLFTHLSASLWYFASAQGVKISANPGNPDPSAMLEVESTTGGLLLPRMTTAQRNAISNPAQGLMIFNTTTSCFEGWTGSAWASMGCCNPLPLAPTVVTAVAGNGQATITFSGGSGSSYTVTSNPGGFTATGPASPLTVTGLSNGVAYTFTVVATNSCGSSPASVASNSVTPTGVSSGTQTFTYTGGTQTFTVPPGVTVLTIDAFGAQGARNFNNHATGGLGARIKGDVNVTPGEVITIIVGGQGTTGSNGIAGGGGGGGSFAIRASNNTPLIVAGGGGGASYQANTNGQPGSASQTPGAGGYTSQPVGNGGFSDNGGGGGTGAGGGGWNGAGTGNNWCGGGQAQGGPGGTSGYNGPGGYGGGGGSYHGGGGGGGYTGGSGGNYNIGGGGGGALNTGTNQTNTAGVRAGNGEVILTW